MRRATPWAQGRGPAGTDGLPAPAGLAAVLARSWGSGLGVSLRAPKCVTVVLAIISATDAIMAPAKLVLLEGGAAIFGDVEHLDAARQPEDHRDRTPACRDDDLLTRSAPSAHATEPVVSCANRRSATRRLPDADDNARSITGSSGRSTVKLTVTLSGVRLAPAKPTCVVGPVGWTGGCLSQRPNVRSPLRLAHLPFLRGTMARPLQR
jgi:hypothetical protein